MGNHKHLSHGLKFSLLKILREHKQYVFPAIPDSLKVSLIEASMLATNELNSKLTGMFIPLIKQLNYEGIYSVLINIMNEMTEAQKLELERYFNSKKDV